MLLRKDLEGTDYILAKVKGALPLYVTFKRPFAQNLY